MSFNEVTEALAVMGLTLREDELASVDRLVASRPSGKLQLNEFRMFLRELLAVGEASIARGKPKADIGGVARHLHQTAGKTAVRRGQGDQVFLGGSCNPTTWRRDVTIPVFEALGVTFYNPQVDDWHPGLVKLEAEAKAAAPVQLYVIDDATRALASMIEVVEMVRNVA